jgi:hypothetical protein
MELYFSQISLTPVAQVFDGSHIGASNSFPKASSVKKFIGDFS